MIYSGFLNYLQEEYKMAMVTCPKCGHSTKQGGYPAWVIAVAICFFPVGLLALLVDKEPTVCNNCGNTFQG